ncbi:kinesin-like protein KIF18A [Lineus longissimus]|uniref:kinesin-like protein KIF18A n=1 Tax=Lineus longissimus TaxID=88925 RepID=UPI00315CCE2E
MTVKNSIYNACPPRRTLVATKSDSDIYAIQGNSNDNIRVVVRVRPENTQEKASRVKHWSVIRVMGEHVLVFDPKDDDPTVEFYRNKPRTGRDIMIKPKRDLKFAFDRVFNDQCTNDIVYDHTAQFVVDGVLNGYNCSVFAYGATGAGKTFTMSGTPQNPGVMYQTMKDLYDRIENIREEKICEVTVSYLEVYNETVRDLLSINHQQSLPVREDPKLGVQIVGLSYHKPDSMDHVMGLLLDGNRNRTQHPTDANAESSRSHAVFQIFVRQRDRTAATHVDHRIAKMSLIDLAGSERATVTKNCGTRFREGANINRSLLALGNVINALADGKVKSQHIPYRDSKLTRILKDSLGGNCRTVMIANISPSSLSFEDTYNTLKYADRAKHIKAEVKSNVVSVDLHVHRYEKIIDDLRQEIIELKRDRDDVFHGMALTPRVSSTGVPYQEEIKKYQTVITSVFSKRLDTRKDLMELEGAERDLSLKLHIRQMCLSRVPLVALDSAVIEKNAEKLQRTMRTNVNSLEGIAKRKVPLTKKMGENDAWLSRAMTEIEKVSADSLELGETLEQTISFKHLEVELADSRQHIAHLKKVARAQERQLQTDSNLIKQLLQVAKRQFLLLKGSGQADSTFVADFNRIESLVCGGREVVWADESSQVNKMDNFNLESVLNFPVLTQAPEALKRARISTSNTTILTPSRRLTRVHQTPRDSSSYQPRSTATPSVNDQIPDDKTPGTENKNLVCFAGRTPIAKPVVHPSVDVENRNVVAASGSITDLISASDEQLRKGDSVESVVAKAVLKRGIMTVALTHPNLTNTGTPGGDKVNYSDACDTDSTFTVGTMIKNSSSVHAGLPVALFQGVGQTVTKSQADMTASTGVNRVPCTPVSGQKPGVVRAMDFSCSRSPGQMSYADAVKSPPSLTAGMHKEGEADALNTFLSPNSGIQPLPITPELPTRKSPISDTGLMQTPKMDLNKLYGSQSSESVNSPFGSGLARRVKSPTNQFPPPVRVPLRDTNSNHNQNNATENEAQQKWMTVSPKKSKHGENSKRNGSLNSSQNTNGRVQGFGYGPSVNRKSFYESQRQKAKHQKSLEVLKRAGLPSMSEKKSEGTAPGYMQMTAAAKRRLHDRSQTAKENEYPVSNIGKAVRQPVKARTQSGPQRCAKPAWQ